MIVRLIMQVNKICMEMKQLSEEEKHAIEDTKSTEEVHDCSGEPEDRAIANNTSRGSSVMDHYFSVMFIDSPEKLKLGLPSKDVKL